MQNQNGPWHLGLRRRRVAAIALLLGVPLGGCEGEILGDGPAAVSGPAEPRRPKGEPAPGLPDPEIPSPGVATPACKPGPSAAAPAALRRLSRTEYAHTVADLLGPEVTAGITAGFARDTILLGFDNNGEAATPPLLLVEQYEQAANTLAAAVTQDPGAFMGCKAGEGDEVCAARFIPTFGLRALRRPLEKDELEHHQRWFLANRAKHGLQGAARMTVQAFLLSPSFLYRLETPGAGGYQLASRLSYLVWSSMPDQALFTTAATGALDDPAGLAREARRMLQDPRAKAGIRNLFGQWLGTGDVELVEKDAKAFPAWKPAIARLMRRETETFVQNEVLGNGTLAALLTAPYSYLDEELAKYYGVPGVTGADFVKVPLNPTQRAGILTQGTFLAAHAQPRQTSPVSRGYFIRERLLCAPPPPPPADLDAKPPEVDSKTTTRERFDRHRKDPACAGCHVLLDPVGFAFEHHDAVGLWRDKDANKPIDVTGQLTATTDADGPFEGAVALAGKLGASSQVRGCLVKQVFRFAYGRAETEADACTLATLDGALAASNGDLKELLVALTQTNAFRQRALPTGGAQ